MTLTSRNESGYSATVEPAIVREGDFWLAELQAIVRAGPWISATDVLQAALDTLLEAYPELHFPFKDPQTIFRPAKKPKRKRRR